MAAPEQFEKSNDHCDQQQEEEHFQCVLQEKSCNVQDETQKNDRHHQYDGSDDPPQYLLYVRHRIKV